MNYVTVALNAVDQDGGNLDNRHLHFAPSDIAWVQSSNFMAPIRPLDVYASGGISTDGTQGHGKVVM